MRCDPSTKPLKSVQSWSPQTRTAFFGSSEFIPLICLPMHYVPAGLFAALAYPMFNYLFRWSDRNWKVRPLAHVGGGSGVASARQQAHGKKGVL